MHFGKLIDKCTILYIIEDDDLKNILPYMWTICDTRFNRTGTLLKHHIQSVHDDKKPLPMHNLWT